MAQTTTIELHVETVSVDVDVQSRGNDPDGVEIHTRAVEVEVRN